MKIVTTVGGLKLPKSETKYIKGSYYKVGDPKIKNSGECYEVDGKFTRANTGYIEYDHEIGQYVRKTDKLVFGIVGAKGSELEEGYFTPSLRNARLCSDDRTYTVLDGKVFKGNRIYREKLSDGVFYNYKQFPSLRYGQIRPVAQGIKRNLPYDSRFIFKDFVKDYEDYEPEVSKEAVNLAKIMKGLSFGLEFETVAGFIPDRISKPLGLMQLRDGSVPGLEFVTVPMEGAKGTQTLIDSIEALSERTRYDMSCSLHLHLGNIPRTKEFIIALYKQLAYIQNDMYRMFPVYKKYNYGVKSKHYTRPLPTLGILDKLDAVIDDGNINKNFNILFEEFSGGMSFSKYNNDLDRVESHPSDPGGQSKWNIRSRYCLFNFIPLIFGNKETVEFRIHTPTYDWEKVRNYMALCANIVNHVMENTNAILHNKKIKKRIAQFATSSRIDRYIAERTRFSDNCARKGEINYDEDKLEISKSYR